MENNTQTTKVYYLYAKKRFSVISIEDYIKYENIKDWTEQEKFGKSIKPVKKLKANEYLEIINIGKIDPNKKNTYYPNDYFYINGSNDKLIAFTYPSDYTIEDDLKKILKKVENKSHKYVLKYKDGILLKDKKYKAIRDCFSAVMAEWGYYDYFWESLTEENKAKNPELESINEFPDWLTGGYGYGRRRSLEDLKNLEVHEYLGTKTPTVKVDYDLYYKVARNFNNLNIALEYGLCVKELYTKMDDNDENIFQYILVYTPANYDKFWFNLKEDELIKKYIKSVKKDDYIKATKYGKTAIAFKNLNDIIPFYRKFSDEDNKRVKMITLDGREIICENEAKIEIRKKLIQNIIEL